LSSAIATQARAEFLQNPGNTANVNAKPRAGNSPGAGL